MSNAIKFGGTSPIINVLIGPPASGKTEATKRAMAQSSNVVRVCLRDIRKSVTGSKIITPKTEALVNSIHDSMIEKAIGRGFDVIVDACNCDFRTLYKKLDYYMSVGKVNLVFMELKSFDSYHVINMARPTEDRWDSAITMKKNYDDFVKTLTFHTVELTEKAENGNPIKACDYNPKLPEAVIIDIDDTISTRGEREPHDYTRVIEDAPRKDMIALLNALDPTIVRIFSTGRPIKCQQDTAKWIDKYFIFNYKDKKYEPHLLMRQKGDWDHNAQVKCKNYDANIHCKYNVIAVIDDDCRALEMYKRKGLNTLLTKNKRPYEQ